jgi:hypothetical protein
MSDAALYHVIRWSVVFSAAPSSLRSARPLRRAPSACRARASRWRYPQAWCQWLATLSQTEWVVYAKPPLAGPQPVLHYLARYTHRVAITNGRLLACTDGHVTFRWKDSQRGNRQRTMRLNAVAFIRRFLLHVLPRGLQRIRHYGFFANGVCKVKLPRCRQLLGQTVLPPQEPSPHVDSTAPASRPPSPSDVCPACHLGRMQVQETWFPQRTAQDVSRPILLCDTS